MRRTKEETEETVNELLEAAFIVFKNKGYKGARLDDVAEAANITRGAISWHFRNKKNLFKAMIRQGAERDIKKVFEIFNRQTDAKIKMQNFIQYLVKERSNKHNHIVIINKVLEDNNEEFREIIDKIKETKYLIMEQIRETLQEGKRTSYFKNSMDSYFTSKFIFTFFWGFFINHNIVYHNYSDDDLLISLIKSFDELIMKDESLAIV